MDPSTNYLNSVFISILNSPDLPLPFQERFALLATLRAVSDECHQQQRTDSQVTELLLEALSTCRSMHGRDKDLLVREGIYGQRWDLLYHKYPTKARQQIHLHGSSFLTYRRFILVLLRTSRKIDHLWTTEQKEKVKSMILSTKSREQLDHLLQRIMDRCLEREDADLVRNDLLSRRYYRLLWENRLDCESALPKDDCDRKPPSRQLVYGNILLPDDPSHQTDSCPICLDPIYNNNGFFAALELSCGHVFCSRCIKDWMRHDPSKQHGRRSSGSGSIANWHCPMCRQSYRELE